MFGEHIHQSLVIHRLEVIEGDQSPGQLQCGNAAGSQQQGPLLGSICDLMVFEVELQAFNLGVPGLRMEMSNLGIVVVAILRNGGDEEEEVVGAALSLEVLGPARAMVPQQCD